MLSRQIGNGWTVYLCGRMCALLLLAAAVGPGCALDADFVAGSRTAPPPEVRYEFAAGDGAQYTLEPIASEAGIVPGPVGLPSLTPDAGTCVAVLTPPPWIAFYEPGAPVVAFGRDRTAELQLWSIGTGECVLPPPSDPDVVQITDCEILEPHGVSCPSGDAPPSARFELVGGLVGGELAPGQFVTLPIRFHAPEGVGNRLSLHPAQLRVKLLDPASVMADGTPQVVYARALGSTAEGDRHPMSATAGGAAVIATPQALVLGPVRTTCDPVLRSVVLHNPSYVPLSIDGLMLTEGCPGVSFATENGEPPSLAAIPPGGSAEVALAFAPRSFHAQICELHVHSNAWDAPTYAVQITGQGTLAGHVVDSFEEPTTRPVDVILVVDDSASMSAAWPQAVFQVGQKLLDALNGTDFRLLVTSADAGAHLGAAFTPWITRETSQAEQVLQTGIALASEGGGDMEQGSAAAIYAALHAGAAHPAAADPTLALRPGARLEVIVVSDENDWSPGPPTALLHALERAKGPAAGRVRLHAVVATDVSCATTEASVASRYVALAQATGGTTTSLCGGDLDAAVLDVTLGPGTTGERSYSLTGTPAAWSEVVVLHDGVACTDGWSHAPVFNAAHVSDGPCFPTPGTRVEIGYTTACP